MLLPMLNCSLGVLEAFCERDRGKTCVCVRLMMLPFTVMTVMITRVQEHIWKRQITGCSGEDRPTGEGGDA